MTIKEPNGTRHVLATWVFGITTSLTVVAIIALTKGAIENEHRLSVLEAKMGHIGYQLQRMEDKLDRILEKR